MSADLKVAVAEYLAQRRARGYKLRDEGALLISFVEFLSERGVEQITVADALAFAQQRADVSVATHARVLVSHSMRPTHPGATGVGATHQFLQPSPLGSGTPATISFVSPKLSRISSLLRPHPKT